MSDQPHIGGPVSVALEADLRTQVRQQGVLLWLDLTDDYSHFVDHLQAERAAGRLPYAVCALRGSYLELMLQLESHAGGVDKPQLIIHLPGLNEQSVQSTPMLELYRAGTRYRKKLDTLVTEASAGKVARPAVEALLSGHTLSGETLTLDAADTWLAAQLDDRSGGLATRLRAMSLAAIVDDLRHGAFLADQVEHAAAMASIWAHLEAAAGFGDDWRAACLPPDAHTPDDVAFALSSWALAVEYVGDLRASPISPLLQPITTLPKPVTAACTKLAVHLRTQHTSHYPRVADETERLLADEVDQVAAKDLGTIDTFRFEDAKVLEAALKALARRRWSTALDWASHRVNGDSLWLRQDPSRRSAWQLIQAAAKLGLRIEQAGPRLMVTEGLDACLDRYTRHGAPADRAHRHLEQRRLALLYPRLPQFEQLRACLDTLRSVWREWADAWAGDFNAVCTEHGFLPPANLQQRTLFNQVVRPMAAERGVTAYFVVDALRYEMGQAIHRALKDTPGTTVQLKARLAELPSVTDVGMNALAPVESGGVLRPSMSKQQIKGFSTGQFKVDSIETRQRAMHTRVGGTTCPWLTLDEVLDRDNTSLKRTISKAKLIVVHSREIDNAGEKGAGPAVFDLVMRKLRAAWRLLRDAGVRRFVITADHGFLLLHDTASTAQSHGRKIDPSRRHVLSDHAVDHADEVHVALKDLGYEGVDGHVIFPKTTAVFDTGKKQMGFVHGGNSLQERVIPVLTLEHRKPAGSDAMSYTIEAQAEEGVAGMHAVSACVSMAAQGGFSFGGQKEVELVLSVVDGPDVQTELCQTRGGARLQSGGIFATVDKRFELFFRLTGHTNARVRVAFKHPSAVVKVAPCELEQRFTVTPGQGTGQAKAPESAESGQAWLSDLSGGVRELFSHLSTHGVVTADEAERMLGGPRKARRFSLKFEMYAAKAPFEVRIDVTGGVKRYVREGGQS